MYELFRDTGSGGAGRYRGGDGVVRDIEFLRPVSVGILSERRNYRPYGLRGGMVSRFHSNQPVRGRVPTCICALCSPGDAAACGMNLLITAEGKILNLTGKNTYAAKAGDRIRVMSPGGGGYGSVDMKQQPVSHAAAWIRMGRPRCFARWLALSGNHGRVGCERFA